MFKFLWLFFFHPLMKPIRAFWPLVKHIHSVLFYPLYSCLSYKHTYTHSVPGNPVNVSLASPQLLETVSIWNKTLRTTPVMSYPGIGPFLSLSFCCSQFDLPSLHLLWWWWCLRPLLLFVPPLIHSAMSPGKYEDELSVSVSLSVSLAAPHSLPLSLPDIKSIVIRLLVNLWWPRHLTAELHQWLKNTESKWGCNGSRVRPWPLIELKDMGNRERGEERKRERERERQRHRGSERDKKGGKSTGCLDTEGEESWRGGTDERM